MEFDLLKAFKMNGLYVLLLATAVVFGLSYLHKVMTKRSEALLKPSLRTFKVFFVLVILWFMVRNIPHESFQWTRPTPDTIFDR